MQASAEGNHTFLGHFPSWLSDAIIELCNLLPMIFVAWSYLFFFLSTLSVHCCSQKSPRLVPQYKVRLHSPDLDRKLLHFIQTCGLHILDRKLLDLLWALSENLFQFPRPYRYHIYICYSFLFEPEPKQLTTGWIFVLVHDKPYELVLQCDFLNEKMH